MGLAASESTRRDRLENRYKGCISWFPWISGFAFIDAIIQLISFRSYSPLDFGVSLVFDIFKIQIDLTLARILIFTIAVILCGVFLLLWHFARQHKYWPIVLGLIILGADSILFAVTNLWFDFGLKIFVLIMVSLGLIYLRQLNQSTSERNPIVSVN